jgi:prepilin-type N-terminal cleavage/methylation domain-containing protein/prepilin-type processing-associated H-X9-DG protein
MKTRNRKRKGFTLVELLVVISIIGMLMALLLPAVQSARESGRANTCRNNMRNVALALAQYDGQKNQLPGYVMPLRTSTQTGAGPFNNDTRSWTFALLPYLDKRSLYDDLRANDVANNDSTMPNLEVLFCPSNPIEARGNLATSYVANCGQIDGTPVAMPGTAAAPARAADFQGNGVFHIGYATVANAPVIVSSLAYIGNSDGQGTTLLLSENADAGKWTDITERLTGFGYHTANGVAGNYPSGTPVAADPMAPNARFGESKATGTIDVNTGYMRPSGYHPGHFNVVFADSHVRVLNDSISYGVFQALCTPKGSAARDAVNGTAPNYYLPSHPNHFAQNARIDEQSL